jgi:hypothetical protein
MLLLADLSCSATSYNLAQLSLAACGVTLCRVVAPELAASVKYLRPTERGPDNTERAQQITRWRK